jgi:hypothetical protein
MKEEVTEAEKAAFISLLRNWWVTSLDAFIGSVGSAEAITFMRPHLLNLGRVAAHNVPSISGVESNDLIGMVHQMSLANRIVHGVEGHTDVWAQHEAIFHLGHCPTKGRSQGACYCACQVVAEAMVLEMNPDFGWELLQTLANGTDECLWNLKNLKEPDAKNESIMTVFTLPPSPKEVLDFWVPATNGVYWVMTTKAMIECMGSEKTLAILYPIAKENGRSFFPSIRDSATPANEESGFGFIQKGYRVFGGEVQPSSDESSSTVVRCPFEGSPVEICKQVESFFCGLCEAYDPDLEFRYEKMKPRGDDCCRWRISRKTPGPKHTDAGASSTHSSLLRNLAMKYAAGEITKAEYDEMRKAILSG